jgi:alpha-L-arabinofuranosidase
MPEFFPVHLRRVVAATFVLACLSVLSYAAPRPLVLAQAPEGNDAPPVISVDLTQTSGKINENAFGVIMGPMGFDVPEKAYFYRTPEGKQALAELGVRSIYYSTDRNDWQNPYDTSTAEPAEPATVMYTDEFLHLNQTLGSDPMLAVNITHLCERADSNLAYSSDNVSCEMATPQMAVDWLTYIKSTGIRNVKYIFMGIEPYAGCEYWLEGINCTTRIGEHKIALTQQEYAKRFVAWVKALRQVDPGLKFGLQLQPKTFLCEVSCNGVSWDETVLKKAGKFADFVVVHQYFQVDTQPQDAASAQRLSYYQNQTDIRVDKNGVTAMPKQIRKELLNWLPKKANMPIFFGEFNAGRTSGNSAVDSVNTRMALYSGMSLAEMYLDAISVVKYKGASYPGATRMVLLNLWSLPVMVAHYLPLDNPTILVKTPGWYMLAALKELQGKTWIKATIKNNPSTPAGRPALRVYGAKQGHNVWIVVFNHSGTSAYVSDVNLNGMVPVSGTITTVGDTAVDFQSQNSADNPMAIHKTTDVIPAAKIKTNKLEAMTFPAHSLTVINLHGE